MDPSSIRLMKDRRFEMISTEDVVVVSSRNREQGQFKENVRSIGSIGLYKPILVNIRNWSRLKKYELICGEGRLLAHRELGKTEIKAEILDVDVSTAHLMTLGENIARTKMASIDFARAIKEMRDMGMSFEQLANITGKSTDYVRAYIRLLEQGEERLIKGIEDGIFTMNFALNVAQSSDRSVQHLLMDAFDNGVVTTTNLGRVRKIIEDRLQKGRTLASTKSSEAPYTVDKLKCDIRQITRQKESYVYEAGQKENRLFRVLIALRELRTDERFSNLMKAEGLLDEPQLKGTYEI